MTDDQLRDLQKAWDELDFTDNIVEVLRKHIRESHHYKLDNFLRLLYPP